MNENVIQIPRVVAEAWRDALGTSQLGAAAALRAAIDEALWTPPEPAVIHWVDRDKHPIPEVVKVLVRGDGDFMATGDYRAGSYCKWWAPWPKEEFDK